MLGPLCAFLSSFTWAVGITAYSQLSTRYSPFIVNFTRACVALPIFLVLGLMFDPHGFSHIQQENVLWLVLSIFCSYALGDVLFLWSTRYLGVPAALAIASSYPLWSALCGVVFLNESLTVARACAMLMILAGLCMVILSGYNRESKQATRSEYFYGLGLAVITSFFWALNTYANNRGGLGLSTYSVNAVRMSSALIFCFALGYGTRGVKKRGTAFLINRADFKKNFPVFIFEGFGGAFFFVYGLTHAPLAVASTLSSLAPAISVPLAVMLGREKVTLLKAIGVLVVVVGVGWLMVG